MIAFVVMAVLGGFLAFILAVASRRFAVETNPLVDEINSVLPAINCGGCGYPGCVGYAEAVALKGADPTLCAPGGLKAGMAIAKILGVAVDETKARTVAVCHCQHQNVKTVAYYTGIQTCRGASLFGLGGGWLDCRYGCLGYGDCLDACPFNAITMGPDHIPVVDETKCTGCKKCAIACPRYLMHITGIDKNVHILCRNRDKGAMANKLCGHSCIICKRCEKACPVQAITIPNNLAEIDHEKCISCDKCVEVCPHSVIKSFKAQRAGREVWPEVKSSIPGELLTEGRSENY